MKVELWMIGKTQENYLETGMQEFQKRLNRYLQINLNVFPDIKNAKKLSPKEIMQKEAQTVLQQLKKEDFLIVLDEKGKQYTSVEFSEWMNQKLQLSHKRMIFLIGGAYGIDPLLKERANTTLALSKMTFSHQMIRLFILEQLYRAIAILNHLPYHNN